MWFTPPLGFQILNNIDIKYGSLIDFIVRIIAVHIRFVQPCGSSGKKGISSYFNGKPSIPWRWREKMFIWWKNSLFPTKLVRRTSMMTLDVRRTSLRMWITLCLWMQVASQMGKLRGVALSRITYEKLCFCAYKKENITVESSVSDTLGVH